MGTDGVGSMLQCTQMLNIREHEHELKRLRIGKNSSLGTLDLS